MAADVVGVADVSGARASILVIAADTQTRTALADALGRRFGADYDIVGDGRDPRRADAPGQGYLRRHRRRCRVRSRRVILAGGVSYRRTGVPSVDALIGRGVFYGAAAGEAASMAGLRVAVLGGGNSAGQAAAHLAEAGAHVTVLVRRDSLAHSMSGYLVTQLEGTPGVTIRCGVQVSEALSEGSLTALVLDDGSTGAPELLPTDALFVFIGAVPHTEWLAGVLTLDAHGFVITGQDGADWLETSMPGVYAAGDMRAGSIKRVAAAVGEGSTAAMLARESLQRTHA